MQLRKKFSHEILEARYRTWSVSELEKDGESELLRMTPKDEEQRAREPEIIIQSDPPVVVYPEDSAAYILVKTTETGLKNLLYDKFIFGKEEDESPRISSWFDDSTSQADTN